MSKSSRVQSNLLQQNCYVRDCVRVTDLKTDSSSESSYFSLDEVKCDDGVKFKKNLYSYPITPSYVNSFVDSSDYRRDPSNAIANGRKRVNLGDCSEIQRIMQLDSASLGALYSQLQAKFGSVPSSDNVSSGNSDNGGDSNG